MVGNETESNLAKGLMCLGVQKKPTFNFFTERLQELPQEQDLNPNQLRDAESLLKEIQSSGKHLLNFQLPLLTPDNQLVISLNLYINDFPAYKNALDKNENLYFCHNKFKKLAKRLGNVLSLDERHTSKIDKYQKSESSHSIISILERDSFKEGLLRLLYHERKINEDEINETLLDEVLPSNIIFVSQLVIEYSIRNKFLFRSDEATYENRGELYILEQDDEDDMVSLISEYICDKKNLSRKSFDWIGRILRKKMNREDIQALLDNQKVKELPQKFDIGDESILFESNNEIVYDSFTTQEENYPQEDKGEIDPIIKSKTLSTSVEKISKTFINQNDREPKGETASPRQEKTLLETGKLDVRNTSRFNRINTYKRDFFNKSNRKIVSSNDRKPVYVGKNREVSKEQQTSQRESAKEIGDKGEFYILDNQNSLLLSSTNYFQKAPTNNKGFDIYEKDQSGQIIRYIEVKTLTGQWGEGGVGITEYQFEFAQKEKGKWWLFVVENINTENTKIYQFKNPVLEANRFMFDSSWKQLSVRFPTHRQN